MTQAFSAASRRKCSSRSLAASSMRLDPSAGRMELAQAALGMRLGRPRRGHWATITPPPMSAWKEPQIAHLDRLGKAKEVAQIFCRTLMGCCLGCWGFRKMR